MSTVDAPQVQVENQLIRFIPSTPIDPEKAVNDLGASRSGDYVIHALESPRATILVDKKGRIVVHGTVQPQAARAAVREFLLRMGDSDEGLSSEKGPVIASFDFGRGIEIERVPIYADEAKLDSALGCLRINDQRHDLELLVWPNGRAITTNSRHANLVAMAAIHWRDKFESEGLFVED
tara:strand:+ start:145 stop:681 length:537 start_codon:yes stop_codon:yes gene_type:complete